MKIGIAILAVVGALASDRTSAQNTPPAQDVPATADPVPPGEPSEPAMNAPAAADADLPADETMDSAPPSYQADVAPPPTAPPEPAAGMYQPSLSPPSLVYSERVFDATSGKIIQYAYGSSTNFFRTVTVKASGGHVATFYAIPSMVCALQAAHGTDNCLAWIVKNAGNYGYGPSPIDSQRNLRVGEAYIFLPVCAEPPQWHDRAPVLIATTDESVVIACPN